MEPQTSLNDSDTRESSTELTERMSMGTAAHVAAAVNRLVRRNDWKGRNMTAPEGITPHRGKEGYGLELGINSQGDEKGNAQE